MTGGLTRLASRSKVKKEDSLRVKSQVSGGSGSGYGSSDVESTWAVTTAHQVINLLLRLTSRMDTKV